MKTEYVQEPDKNYLVIQMEEEEDNFAVAMLSENKLDGILCMEKKSFNGEFRFYYDITGKHSIKSRLRKHLMTGEELRILFREFYQVIGTLSSHFLNIHCLAIDTSYIYEEKGKLFFCYFPLGREMEEKEKLLTFAEQLLENIDQEDEDAVLLGYQFYKSAGEDNKTILQILEDVLLQETSDSFDQEELNEESKPDVIFCEEEETEIINDIKLVFSKPDLWTFISFGFSFFICLVRLFFIRETILWFLFVWSLLGMSTALVDIDIKDKK